MNLKKTKLFLFAGSLLLTASCSKTPNSPGTEFMPDMYRNPAYKAYEVSPLYSDSASARLPVQGTIPRGYTTFNYPSSNDGYQAAGRDLVNPLEANAANLAEGKRLYTNFCMHCHGAEGKADGSLIKTGKFPPPPNFLTAASSRGGNLRDLTDGKIFHTITYGVNLMGAHGSQLNTEERWKITMHVKQLFAAAAPAPSETTTASVIQ